MSRHRCNFRVSPEYHAAKNGCCGVDTLLGIAESGEATAGEPVIAANLRHSETRMTERHYAHLVPSHVAQVIRATMPKLGLVEQSYVVPLTPAPTTVPQLATRFVRNWCLPGHDAPHWIAECHSPCG